VLSFLAGLQLASYWYRQGLGISGSLADRHVEVGQPAGPLAGLRLPLGLEFGIEAIGALDILGQAGLSNSGK